MTRHALTSSPRSHAPQGLWELPLTRRALLSTALGTAGTALLAGCTSAPDGAATTTTGADGRLSVVASFYALYDFTSKVAGDHASVTNLVPAGTEPHDWEPSPSDMAAIQDADLLVYNGADMEGWVDDLLSSLGDQAPASVMASTGIDLRQSGEAEGGDDHGHGSTDPHVWLAPKNAAREMANIKDALAAADPDHADDYQGNYDEHAADFDALDQEYASRLASTSEKTIVVAHEAFGYLCDAYGLTQVAITGMDAEGEPDAQTMAAIIDQVQANGVRTIFSEDLVSPKVAQAIADATGATCEILNPLEGLTQAQLDNGEDYVSVMRANLDKLVEALS